MLPLVVGLGGLIAGIIVFRLAPEAEGHGTDAAIAAFHHGPRGIRTRIPLVKLVASAITIGSGGSGGREGPTAQIGAGFGSFLARLLDLDARDARIAVSTGMGAGIGAIFRAPLGGAVLAVEIPYRDDVESDALVPAFVASIVAFSIFGAIVGFDPIFGRVAGAGFTDPRQLIYYALIGLAAGVVGRLYIASFYGITRWFKTLALAPRAPAGGRRRRGRLHRPRAAGRSRHGLRLGPGGLRSNTLLGLPLWVILALPFAKILATSLSIGSGGSGGIFGPGMVIGGLLGAGIWRLLEPFAPGVPIDPSPFVIVAMMALFGSIAHAPLAVMLMVAEMTDSLAMLAPAMLAIGIATLIVGDRSIYASQLRNRAESPAHRFRFALPLMTAIPAGDAARSPRVVLRTDQTVAAARAGWSPPACPARRSRSGGSCPRQRRSRHSRRRRPSATVGDLAIDGTFVSADDSLDDVLGILADGHQSWVPVVANDRLAGILSTRDVVAAYRGALAANVRQVSTVGSTGRCSKPRSGRARFSPASPSRRPPGRETASSSRSSAARRSSCREATWSSRRATT